MRRVGVVGWLLLVACDRGAPPRSAPPPNATIPAAPSDATADGDPSAGANRVDAAPIDAEIPVDALPLAPPKAAAAQNRDCAKIAKLHIGRTYDIEERRDLDAGVRKLCVETPWSATIVDCMLRAKPAETAWDCLEQLPSDQRTVFYKMSEDVDCRYNDCIRDYPSPPSLPGLDH